MKKYFKDFGRYLALNGKTYWAFWWIGYAIYVPNANTGTYWWFLMLMIVGIFMQSAVNECYRRSPLQDVFDEVNAARKNRIHQERMTRKLTDGGLSPEVAKKAASMCIDVLHFADYALPAA